MKNIKNERLNKLRTRARDVYTAYQWLDTNRDKFKGEVYDPLCLLVKMNFKITK